MSNAFLSCEYVERKKEGFKDAGTWAYLRADDTEEYNFQVDEDWVIGSYVAVVEDERESMVYHLLLKAQSVISSVGGEITGISDNADTIFLTETEIERTREMNVCKIAFTLRSPNVCSMC